MINFYNRITKQKQEQLFYDNGILDKEGRLTDDGLRVFADLLFIGKTTQEAKDLIQKEIEEDIKKNKKD